MGVLTLAAARVGKGRMDRGGGLGHRGMLYRGLGGSPAVKSLGRSTWRAWMSCRTGGRRRTEEFGSGGLVGLKEVSEVGWLEGKGPGGFG